MSRKRAISVLQYFQFMICAFEHNTIIILNIGAYIIFVCICIKFIYLYIYTQKIHVFNTWIHTQTHIHTHKYSHFIYRESYVK